MMMSIYDDDDDGDDDNDDDDVFTLAHFPGIQPVVAEQATKKRRLDGRRQKNTYVRAPQYQHTSTERC